MGRVEADFRRLLEGTCNTFGGGDADSRGVGIRSFVDFRHAARKALHPARAESRESRLAVLVSDDVVRRRNAGRIEEVLELPQAPGPQLRLLADGRQAVHP